MRFRYGVDKLTVDVVMRIAKGEVTAILSPEAVSAIRQSRSHVETMLQSDSAVYGVNTGFGPLCDTKISVEQTGGLQHNLLVTHAVGVGSPIDRLLSKIMMICKVHALAQGFSGIRLEVVERIIYFIDNELLPVVPEQGSVGASGDLAPLSHLFLPLIGHGELWQGEDIVSATTLHDQLGLQPLQLAAKEGIALINGTQFILAHAILAVHRMHYVLDLADVCGAMSVEGYQGNVSPYRKELHQIRPFRGNIDVAARMTALLEGSDNLGPDKAYHRVQDPYSLRCIPPVHGASRNAYYHLADMVDIELNAVTDNPIILSSTEAISGGNFHGQPLAIVLDYAKIAAAELGNISDRRCYLLLEGHHGLPRMLTRHAGLHSGLMIPQYTTAALVSENKSLCFPASADSIPTSMGQEDHVSMGSISGRQLNQVLDNLEQILAIELMYAAQAIDLRRPNRCSPYIEAVHQTIRRKVNKLEEDRILKDDIDTLVAMVRDRAIEVSITL